MALGGVTSKITGMIQRLPGPGKLIFGGLSENPQAFRVLAACLLAIFATYWTPPVITLSSPPIQQGLRDIGSGTPFLVGAGYLLLAILTLVGGVTGDVVGRKRFLLVGLVGIVLANVLGLFWLDTPMYARVQLLFKLAQTAIAPMSIALVTVTFLPSVRPFAYGMIFGGQGIALASAPSLNWLLGQVGIGRLSFLPSIVLGIVGFWHVRKDVYEVATGRNIPKRELIVNLLWSIAVFGAIFGLIGVSNDVTAENTVLAIAIGLVALLIGYRWFYTRFRRRDKIKLYDVRNLSLAILAGVALAMAQGTLFYQIWPYFEHVQGVGPVMAGMQVAPYFLSMLVGTTLVVRLSMRFGARRLMSGGLLLMAAGLAMLAPIATDTPYVYMVLPLALMGLGLGIAGPARTVVVLSAPPPSLIGMGAAINTAAGQSGYALGIVWSSFVLTGIANNTFDAQLHQAGISPIVVQSLNNVWNKIFARTVSGNGASAVGDLAPDLTQWLNAQFAAAYTAALGQTLLLMAGVLAIVAVVLFVGMQRGLQGSFIQPIATTQDPGQQ